MHIHHCHFSVNNLAAFYKFSTVSLAYKYILADNLDKMTNLNSLGIRQALTST